MVPLFEVLVIVFEAEVLILVEPLVLVEPPVVVEPPVLVPVLEPPVPVPVPVLEPPVPVEVPVVGPPVPVEVPVVLVGEVLVVEGVVVAVVELLVVPELLVVEVEVVVVDVLRLPQVPTTLITLSSNVTAPFRANRPPLETEPVTRLIDVVAITFPTKSVPEPSVAELPITQRTPQAWPPLIMTTLESEAVVREDPIWKTQRALEFP
jgi:hypothetical protein